MKRLAIIGLAVMMVMGFAAYAGAVPFSFYNITNNGNPDVGAQLYVDVTASDGQVLFWFHNVGDIASSITDIYFDDGTLLALSTITDSGDGVAFAAPAVPGNLPGANLASPPFVTTADFSADSDNPIMANGVNNYTGQIGEVQDWVGINFTLLSGKSFADTIAALDNGTLRIGLHIQAIGTTGGSDSYVNGPPIPEPSTFLLLGAGLVGVGLLRRKFKK
jgi:hypothetical protein